MRKPTRMARSYGGPDDAYERPESEYLIEGDSLTFTRRTFPPAARGERACASTVTVDRVARVSPPGS
jgi:hypothetical protein